MLDALRKRLDQNEEGFTLIELMVVVLIIGILIAIAIPTFLGAQDRARDRGAQSDLRNSITNAKAIATDNGGLLTNVTAANLNTAEGSITHVAGTGSATTVGVNQATPAADAVLVFTASESGTWFGMATSRTGDVGYCRGTEAAVDITPTVDASGNLAVCNGAAW